MKTFIQSTLMFIFICASVFTYNRINTEPKTIICYKSGVKTFQGQVLGRPVKYDEDSIYIDSKTMEYVQVQGHCSITHS